MSDNPYLPTLPSVDTRADSPTGLSPERVRGAVTLLFLIYVGLLVWVVLWKLHVPFLGRDDMREIKLLPFAAGDGYGPSAPFEVIGNMAIFIPFGIYLGMLAPRWSWWKVIGVVAGASLALELVQYVTAVGSTDVTDLIVNTAGGLVGFGVLAIVRRGAKARTAVTVTWILTAGTVLALVMVGLIIASFPQIGPPHA